MLYRNRRRVDVTDKAGPEFDDWLNANVADRHHRDWYRTDTIARQVWLDKLEKDIGTIKPARQ